MLGTIAEFLTESSIGDFMSENIRAASKLVILGKYSSLADGVKNLLSASLVFACVIHGINVMTGATIGTLRQLVITCVWVVGGVGLASPQIFTSMIYNPFFASKDALTSFIMIGESSSTIYSAFSDANSRMFAHAANIMDKAGWSDVALYLTAIAIYVIYGIYYMAFLAVTLYAELSVNVLMLFGCLVIPLSGFQSARGLGRSWLIALFKYYVFFVVVSFVVSVLNVLTSALVSELIAEIYISKNATLDTANVKLDSPIFGCTLLTGAFGIYLLFQAMEIASELTGGVMSDGKAGLTAVGNAASNSASAAKGVGISGAGTVKGGLAAYKVYKRLKMKGG